MDPNDSKQWAAVEEARRRWPELIDQMIALDEEGIEATAFIEVCLMIDPEDDERAIGPADLLLLPDASGGPLEHLQILERPDGSPVDQPENPGPLERPERVVVQFVLLELEQARFDRLRARVVMFSPDDLDDEASDTADAAGDALAEGVLLDLPLNCIVDWEICDESGETIAGGFTESALDDAL